MGKNLNTLEEVAASIAGGCEPAKLPLGLPVTKQHERQMRKLGLIIGTILRGQSG